jgi:predicted dehydrogenase/NADPH:quinone reductase-like Zn-dependent oxidoreductase
MKQVTQRLRDGRIEVLDVPVPIVTDDGVLVDVRASLLSAGTERTKVIAGRRSLVAKARSRPDQVQHVLNKARRDGIRETMRAVRLRLDEPSPLGYSVAGVVLTVGRRVRDLRPGDRVACAGAEYAVHAEIDHVPGNLCVPLPESLSFEVGAFTTVGSIAVHGVRQADVRFGERVAVVGMGLIGQLAGQILRAAGCTVVGIDLSEELLNLARRTGAADHGFPRYELGTSLPAAARGCDAVIITAATRSDDPVELAAALCRDRARVVVVGHVGMQLPRSTYYGKELELRLSRSYGPGRYDREYEERGLDYPIGYVRWTEHRNMSAFLELLATRRIDVEPLITSRVAVEHAPAAYDRLLERGSPLGIVLQYGPVAEAPLAPSATPIARAAPGQRSLEVGLIGAGSFAQATIIPALRAAGFRLHAVASATGRSAEAARRRFGFDRALTVDELLHDPEIGVVIVCTRHASHAALAEAALDAGKAVFVEKPPGLTLDELDRLEAAAGRTGLPLMAGFNRRYAPLASEMRQHVRSRGPFCLTFRVNAGRLPEDHWLNDLDDGGGRLLGEGCHFVDFACWMAGALPDRVSCSMTAEPDHPLAAGQSFAVTLAFEDASLATVMYCDGGAYGVPKERIEVHAGGRSAILNDFRTLTLVDGRRARSRRSRSQDKGHRRQFALLRELVDGRWQPDPPDQLASMRVTLTALAAAQRGTELRMADPGSDA